MLGLGLSFPVYSFKDPLVTGFRGVRYSGPWDFRVLGSEGVRFKGIASSFVPEFFFGVPQNRELIPFVLRSYWRT